MTEGARESLADTGIRVIPPFVFLLAIAAALILEWIIPTTFGLAGIVRWPLAVVLIAVPFLLLPSIFASFRRAESEYDVRYVPRQLVTEGAFRYSRNPGYVAMIAFTLGVGVAFDTLWILLTVIPAILFVHFRVVLREEDVLERQFGDAYRDYQRRVRRWV